jgi:hypothetical protein
MLRKVIQAAAIIALLTGPAVAQMPMPSISLQQDKPPPTPEEVARQKALDNAYNSAARKIPDKKLADPWGDIRTPPNTSAKNKPQ